MGRWPERKQVRLAGVMGFVWIALALVCLDANSQDISIGLMNSTFEISGPGREPNTTSFGTVFILGRPRGDDPKQGYYVLVTAAHVLDDIKGDVANLLLREKQQDGSYRAFESPIHIRQLGQPLYVKHSEADVAAMYISIPLNAQFSVVSTTSLVVDDELNRIELHPGDVLSCLGFPLAITLDGFPVIRTGLLASYPVTPSRVVKKFFYTFHIFPGNSGSPVYYSYTGRIFGNVMHVESDYGIVGLVSQQQNSTLPGYTNAEIDIAIIVPSVFIAETIALLPAAPPSS
jgi:hypothetical protein